MSSDRHDPSLGAAGDEAARHYERALDALLFFRPEMVTESAALLRAAPRSAMARVFGAYLALMGTEEKDVAGARATFGDAAAPDRTAGLPPRERMHVAAAAAWLDGDVHRAGSVLAELSAAHPGDALALAVGHQIDFLTGDARSLRDRVGGALSAWDRDDPHYGPLLGMFAFGLEECGHYGRSEEVGREAVERNPKDVWAIHSVVHNHEMQGRFADGIRFLDARTGDWATGNFLQVHNWWHYALYALESDDTARVLRVYDESVRHAESQPLAMQLLDASSLLWRLLLAGTGTGGRWAELAGAWAGRDDGAHYAFNDVHAVMAYVGAGRFGDAERLVADRRAWLRSARPEVGNRAMTEEIGLPVCGALIAYGRGRYEEAVGLLLPIRHRLHRFGGSHAQRDAVERTLVEAALRAGLKDLARRLLSERVNVRPVCPYNWRAGARLAELSGDAEAAKRANARAAEQAARGAAALGGR